MFVCHKCDNPLCVNPEHLFLGTHEENMKDASRKGRLNQRKLTERQVFNIRMSNLSNQQLARKYGVWDSTIRRIRKYETWNKKG
jgi:DNA-binding transcriptional regulator YiaG